MAKSIAVIVTTKNEQDSIRGLLDSIIIQTITPKEVIVVDADSSDSTREIVSSYRSKIPGLKLVRAERVNRSKGRNLGIKKAKSSIIAVTDAGCVLKKGWLKRITHPILSGEADAVAGFYFTQNSTLMQISSAPFVATMPDQIDPHVFLPSSRSVAFTKEAWKSAGKYPEDLSYCEDLVFAQKLKTMTDMVVQPRALVYWDHYKDLRSFYSQVRNYASGDVEARHIPHLKKIVTVYLRYILFFIFKPLFFVYLLWPIYKHIRHVRHPLAIFTLPLLQIVTDMGILFGSFRGLRKSFRRK